MVVNGCLEIQKCHVSLCELVLQGVLSISKKHQYSYLRSRSLCVVTEILVNHHLKGKLGTLDMDNNLAIRVVFLCRKALLLPQIDHLKMLGEREFYHYPALAFELHYLRSVTFRPNCTNFQLQKNTK